MVIQVNGKLRASIEIEKDIVSYDHEAPPVNLWQKDKTLGKIKIEQKAIFDIMEKDNFSVFDEKSTPPSNFWNNSFLEDFIDNEPEPIYENQDDYIGDDYMHRDV